MTVRFWWANFLNGRLKDFYLKATSAIKSKPSFQLMPGKTIRFQELLLFFNFSPFLHCKFYHLFPNLYPNLCPNLITQRRAQNAIRVKPENAAKEAATR